MSILTYDTFMPVILEKWCIKTHPTKNNIIPIIVILHADCIMIYHKIIEEEIKQIKLMIPNIKANLFFMYFSLPFKKIFMH